MSLEKAYQHYKDQATIYLVYIREAHPADGWWTKGNVAAGIHITDPRTQVERDDVAGQCMSALRFTVPCLVDGIDNVAEKAYAAYPDRIYVIDPAGKIAYKSGSGPRGFRPREMEVALRNVLGETAGTFVTPEDKPLSRRPRSGDIARALAETIDSFRDAWDAPTGVMRPLDDEAWQARAAALCDLVKLGPESLSALTAALNDDNPEVRGLVAQAIGYLGDASAADTLDRVLADDPDPTVRLYATDALGMVGGMKTDLLYELVAELDDNQDVRARVQLALSRNGVGLSPDVRNQFEEFRPDAIDTARLGEPAPDFTLTDVQGKAHRLSDLRGKNAAILTFIYGTGTYGLVRQYEAKLKDFEERGAQVFVIDPHDSVRVRHLLTKAGFQPDALPVPVLCDPAHVVSATYGVAFQMRQHTEWSNRPATFLIDREGLIRYAHRGQNYGDRPRPQEVLQEFDKLNEEGKFVALFDGKTLDGWTVRGGKATYQIEDGVIVGTTVEGSPNTFLCTKKDYGDFELLFEVKCDKALNSGVQIRSHAYHKDTTLPGEQRLRLAGTVYGYQCEIAAATTSTSGNFWDEARHKKWLDDFSQKPEAQKAFQDGEWNAYRIVAQGDRIRSWVNGAACADFRDKEDASGFIGLQVHSVKPGTGPYQVRWRKLQIRELKPGQEE